MKFSIVILLFSFHSLTLLAQDYINLKDSLKNKPQYKIERFNAGFGLGIDHGGIGFDITYFVIPSFGFTGCFGVRILGPGLNAGIKYRFLPRKPESRTIPFLLAIYGTNYKNVYSPGGYWVDHKYGPTFGYGLDWISRKSERMMWSFAILLPVRDPDYDGDNPALSFGIKYRGISDIFK